MFKSHSGSKSRIWNCRTSILGCLAKKFGTPLQYERNIPVTYNEQTYDRSNRHSCQHISHQSSSTEPPHYRPVTKYGFWKSGVRLTSLSVPHHSFCSYIPSHCIWTTFSLWCPNRKLNRRGCKSQRKEKKPNQTFQRGSWVPPCDVCALLQPVCAQVFPFFFPSFRAIWSFSFSSQHWDMEESQRGQSPCRKKHTPRQFAVPNHAFWPRQAGGVGIRNVSSNPWIFWKTSEGVTEQPVRQTGAEQKSEIFQVLLFRR